MTATILGAVLALATAAHPSPVAWDSQDPIEAFHAAAEGAKPAGAEAGKKKAKEEPKKPTIKYDSLRLPLFFNQNLLGVSARLVARELLQPFQGMPDASQRSSLLYPLVYVYYIQQPSLPMLRPVVFAFYVVGEDELGSLQRATDSELPLSRLKGFATDGVRYFYLLTSTKPEERALAEQFVDELDGRVLDPELLWTGTVDWHAKTQFDFWIDQYFSSERRSAEAEERARENPWWKQDRIDQELLDRMTTRYELKTLADVNADGASELLVYTSDPERLDERGDSRRSADPSHKWNTLYVGLEVTDGHRAHSDRLHFEHAGKTYCARAPIGGWWNEPLTAGFGGKIVLLYGLPEGSPGPNAILLSRKDGSGKAIFTLEALPEAPHRMLRTEVRELDSRAVLTLITSAERAEILSRDIRRAEAVPLRNYPGGGR